MAEGDAARAFVCPYQLVALGRGEIVELVLTPARRFQHPDLPGALQGRGQEDRPGRGREPHDPGGEQLLQALTERQHRRKRLPRRALRVAQRLRQLQQGERVAPRRVQHPASHPGIEAGKPGPHQVVSRLVIQGLQLIFQQAAPVKVAFRAGPAGSQQPHPAAAEPSRHEAQHAGAGPVDPGQVVDDQENRHSCGRVPQQGQRGVGYQQPLWCGPGSETEGHPQRVPVGGVEFTEVTKQREQRLVEPGKADLLLELRAGRAHHQRARRGCGVRQDIDQRRLAHAGISRQEQRPAADRGLPEKVLQETELPVSSDQRSREDHRLAHRRGPVLRERAGVSRPRVSPTLTSAAPRVIYQPCASGSWPFSPGPGRAISELSELAVSA